jgi:ABC-2 type transport system permease protein
VQEGSPWLAFICELNPFTHAVELIRFALYEKINLLALAVVLGAAIIFLAAAIAAYDPSRGMLKRREGP